MHPSTKSYPRCESACCLLSLFVCSNVGSNICVYSRVSFFQPKLLLSFVLLSRSRIVAFRQTTGVNENV